MTGCKKEVHVDAHCMVVVIAVEWLLDSTMGPGTVECSNVWLLNLTWVLTLHAALQFHRFKLLGQCITQPPLLGQWSAFSVTRSSA